MRYDVEDLRMLPGEGEETATDMVIKARCRDMGGDFSVMEGVIEPNHLLAPHTHKYEDQMVYVITSELEFEVGGEGGLRFSAPAGSYVQKPRGIVHTFWNKTDTPARYIELSGQEKFEGFVDSRRDGMKSNLTSDRDWGIAFSLSDIPRLMKEHGLTGLSNAEIPDFSKLPEVPQAIKKLFKRAS